MPRLTALASWGRLSRHLAGATHLGRAAAAWSFPRQVLDLQLTGEMDSAAAHYKLLQSGSLRGGEPKGKGGKAATKAIKAAPRGKAAPKAKAAPEANAAPEAAPEAAPKRRKR